MMTATHSRRATPSNDENNLYGDESPSISKRRKDLFGDCALIEIIHLHDCLRGALKTLERDVEALKLILLKGEQNTAQLNEIEGKVNGRFKVIWSVFRAHSSAEDEFIWPALQLKMQGRVKGSSSYKPDDPNDDPEPLQKEQTEQISAQQLDRNGPSVPKASQSATSSADDNQGVDQEAYEEDHADEERMFSDMDSLLTLLREGLIQQQSHRFKSNSIGARVQPRSLESKEQNGGPSNDGKSSSTNSRSVNEIVRAIHELTQAINEHLMAHLEKEEKQCLPLVVKHMSKSEIHDLVGQIMGKRSSDMISEIMTMAVDSLNQADRLEMVKYMKQAMAGTFFDKWLSMSGWMEDVDPSTNAAGVGKEHQAVAKGQESRKRADLNSAKTNNTQESSSAKRTKLLSVPLVPNITAAPAVATSSLPTDSRVSTNKTFADSVESSLLAKKQITSQSELEKLIRAIATNPTLNAKQKNTTIQGLRDSVWKSNQRVRASQKLLTPSSVPHAYASSEVSSAAVSATCIPVRRVTPPSLYYKKNTSGKLDLAWDIDNPRPKPSEGDAKIPFFSASELAPTYHDGATGGVLGCPHYARACKLRHPVSGRLYTCRLCCEQEREMPSKDKDEPLDRYAVQEVMCMKCNSLQPADDRCINPNCESEGKPFAKYYCKICHLYDDRSKPIFHCPYCNTCRMGLGLGIDFRHCMRCNACVSLDDKEHRCIPQKLQGSCPICHESLFQSTEPLRGLKCGHVMHLSCFTQYRRGQRYTCPLCMKSMEDMSDYFALLDAAVRMQPMPVAYLSTMSSIYCQDCEKSGTCPYHFVGLKCPHCGSYNTREMGRVQNTNTATTFSSG